MIKPPGEKSTGNKRISRRGFSLIELLISSAITFFLLLGAGQLVLHSILFQHTSDKTLKAVELASRKSEYLKSLSYDDIDAGGEEKSEIVAEEGTNGSYCLSWTGEEVSPGFKRIIITCFPENDSRRTVKTVLLLSKYLGF